MLTRAEAVTRANAASWSASADRADEDLFPIIMAQIEGKIREVSNAGGYSTYFTFQNWYLNWEINETAMNKLKTAVESALTTTYGYTVTDESVAGNPMKRIKINWGLNP